jgi:hypothetical protein
MNLHATSMGCPICLYVTPSVSLRCASFTMQRTAIQHRQHHVASSWVSTKDFSFRGHWGSLQDVPSKRPHVPIQPGFSALFIAAQQLLPCHRCWCILGGDPRLAWGFTSISASAKLLLSSAGHCSSNCRRNSVGCSEDVEICTAGTTCACTARKSYPLHRRSRWCTFPPGPSLQGSLEDLQPPQIILVRQLLKR